MGMLLALTRERPRVAIIAPELDASPNRDSTLSVTSP